MLNGPLDFESPFTGTRGAHSSLNIEVPEDLLRSPSLAPPSRPLSPDATSPSSATFAMSEMSDPVDEEMYEPALVTVDPISEVPHHESPETNGRQSTLDSSQLPPEIQVLLDCHKAGVPINVVIHKESAFLPFRLPESCEYAFLGFFTVKEVRVSDLVLYLISDILICGM